MKVNQINRTGEKARIWAGFLLILTLGSAEIRMFCQQSAHNGHKVEQREDTPPFPCQDVYLPPWQ